MNSNAWHRHRRMIKRLTRKAQVLRARVYALSIVRGPRGSSAYKRNAEGFAARCEMQARVLARAMGASAPVVNCRPSDGHIDAAWSETKADGYLERWMTELAHGMEEPPPPPPPQLTLWGDE